VFIGLGELLLRMVKLSELKVDVLKQGRVVEAVEGVPAL
jgi:hypothetical protein